MHPKSKFLSGTVLRITVDNPYGISAQDVINYLELGNLLLTSLSNQDKSKLTETRRKIAKALGLPDLPLDNIEIDGNALVITIP